jgi:hypothetical protein
MSDKIKIGGKEYSLAKISKKLWAVLVDGQPSKFQIKPHRQRKQNFWAIIDTETGFMGPQVYSSRGYAFVMAMHALP